MVRSGWPSDADLRQKNVYWVGTRDLLPAAWRWIKGCSHLARSSINDSLSLLALSALERMVQVLKYRDVMHRHLNQPVRDVRGDDAIEAFEAALAMMMAAVDITARVAHKVLDIKILIRRAGWQNSDWLPKAAESVPGIDNIVAPQSPNSDALIILRHLRNTLHSEAMRGAGIHRPGRAPTALMALPSEHQADVLTAMERLGGKEAWSIQSYAGPQLRADPGTLPEASPADRHVPQRRHAGHLVRILAERHTHRSRLSTTRIGRTNYRRVQRSATSQHQAVTGPLAPGQAGMEPISGVVDGSPKSVSKKMVCSDQRPHRIHDIIKHEHLP